MPEVKACLVVDEKKGKMTYQQPIAEIISCCRQGEALQTILKLNHIPASPIAPASLYEQHQNRAKVLGLHKVVQRTGTRITFQTYDYQAIPLKSGRAYVFISWWSLDQLKLVRDNSRRWKKNFTPQNAVDLSPTDTIRALRLRREGEDVTDGVLIARGWDHEHCFLCWRKIFQGDDDNDAGYSDGEIWLCEDCYGAYIVSDLGRKLGK